MESIKLMPNPQLWQLAAKKKAQRICELEDELKNIPKLDPGKLTSFASEQRRNELSSRIEQLREEIVQVMRI